MVKYNPEIHTKEFLDAQIKAKGKPQTAEDLGISLMTLYRWEEDPPKIIRSVTKKTKKDKSSKTPVKKKKKLLPNMEEAMAMVKKRLARLLEKSMKEHGFENVGHRRLYDRFWGKNKRDRQTVELAFHHLLEELKLEGY